MSTALFQWESDGTIAALQPAARRVISDLAAVLEPTVDVAFSADYAEHLRRAEDDVLRS